MSAVEDFGLSHLGPDAQRRAAQPEMSAPGGATIESPPIPGPPRRDADITEIRGLGQVTAETQACGAQPPTLPPGGTRAVLEPVDAASRRAADALLLLHADILDDLEQLRIATENRLRSLLSDESWGKGVNPMLPAVTVIEDELATLKALEHGAELVLKRAMRAHPLGPWVKRTVGVGEKQAARLLAAIGDPAERRTVSQLWAFCGLHVIVPGGQGACAAHLGTVAGDDSLSRSQGRSDNHRGSAPVDGHPGDQSPSDPHAMLVAGVAQPLSGDPNRDDIQVPSVSADGHPGDQRAVAAQPSNVAGVAPSRRKGQKANWSTTAKTRCFLVAESCMKQRSSPYRATYETGRVKYADAVHAYPCARCGPAGKPAAVGSPLSSGHQHARAMRLVMKAVLRDLWVEARNLT